MLVFPTNKQTSSKTAYEGDSGTDIGCPTGTPVYAVGDARVIYAEYGHTPWQDPPDTAYSIKLFLDKPIKRNGFSYPFVFYTHLSSIEYLSKGQQIKAGRLIGHSGVGNNVPHLHISFSVDSAVSQYIESLDGQDMMWNEWPQLSPIEEELDMFAYQLDVNESDTGYQITGALTGKVEGKHGHVFINARAPVDVETKVDVWVWTKTQKKRLDPLILKEGKPADRAITKSDIEGPFAIQLVPQFDEKIFVSATQWIK